MIVEYLCVMLVAIFAGIVAAISGFGIGSLVTPLFALRIDLPLAVAAVSIPHLIGTAYRFILIKNDLNRKVLIEFGIWSAIGGLVGGLLAIAIHNKELIIVFALLLTFTGSVGALGYSEKMRFPKNLSWIAGLTSGAFGGMAGNQGGIRSAALLGFNLSKTEFVATTTAIGLIVDFARMPVYFYFQWSNLLQLWLPIILATIGVLAGTWLGRLVLHKIPESIFKRIVSVLILLIGISMFFKQN